MSDSNKNGVVPSVSISHAQNDACRQALTFNMRGLSC